MNTLVAMVMIVTYTGLSTLAQKRIAFSIIVGLYKAQKVKGCLLSPFKMSVVVRPMTGTCMPEAPRSDPSCCCCCSRASAVTAMADQIMFATKAEGGQWPHYSQSKGRLRKHPF